MPFQENHDRGSEPRALPIIACLRVATMARVAGRPHGIQLDRAYGGELAGAYAGFDAASRASQEAAAEHWARTLGGCFADAIKAQAAAGLKNSHLLLAEPAGASFTRWASEACQGMAAPLAMVAAPHPSAWELFLSLGTAHLGFDDERAARLALGAALDAAIDAMAAQGAQHGFRIEPGALLADAFECYGGCAPCCPDAPFSAIVGGYPGQSRAMWPQLAAIRASAVEQAELRRVEMAGGGAASGPACAPRL